jgi:hypothetical protein
MRVGLARRFPRSTVSYDISERVPLEALDGENRGERPLVRVDLIYEAGCPHAEEARANLSSALTRTGRAPRWHEYRIGSPDLPDYARGYGSPTVLVDGRDVAGAEPGSDACCRLYGGPGGTAGAPPVDAIAAALEALGG